MTDALANEVSSSVVSVSVRRLDIKYKVYEDQVFSARELVGRGFRSRKSTIVHAIKDLSFDFHIGEAVGIVGSNGSGKSTLLRAIAGLQSPASGAVFVRGEPHLLGVGAALKPALSGYRNVMLGRPRDGHDPRGGRGGARWRSRVLGPRRSDGSPDEHLLLRHASAAVVLDRHASHS